MDRADLDGAEARAVTAELNELVYDLRSAQLPVSSWYGMFDASESALERANRGYGYGPLSDAADDEQFPWFLYWEIAWLTIHNEFKEGDSLLDLGGSSSLFSYYMASKGLDVSTVDLNLELVENANRVAGRRGWNLQNHHMDMRSLALTGPFDHITSVCVFEHIPLSGRIDVTSQIKELLRDGGTFSITFDYLNPAEMAQISSPEAVHDQFVGPSGLQVRGNEPFHDNGRRYLIYPPARLSPTQLLSVGRGELEIGEIMSVRRKNDYTFGALFLEKDSSRAN
jgi:2-polyprenyl-3-methyl-5-hydroxy-6-metoxy-1,4-benzoquinol methylase